MAAMLDHVFDRDFWHAYRCDTQVSTRSMTDVHGSGLNVRKKMAIRFNVSCISTAMRCHLLMRMASLDVSESRVRVRMSGSWIA